MFINLVNTTIPFEEYQLTQEKIDALKYRLLWSEGYLHAYELNDSGDPFENYHCFLLLSERKLMFLVVGKASVIDEGCPLISMVDMSEAEPRQLSEEEIINFLSDAYSQNPEKAITGNFVSIDKELDAKLISLHLDNFLDHEPAEKENIKRIILKKIYNYDYQPKL